MNNNTQELPEETSIQKLNREYKEMLETLAYCLALAEEERLFPTEVFGAFNGTHRTLLYDLLRPMEDLSFDTIIDGLHERSLDLSVDNIARLATIADVDLYGDDDVEDDEIVVQMTGSITDADVQEQIERLHNIHGYGLADILRQL